MTEKQVVVGPKLLIVVLNRRKNAGKNSKYAKSSKSPIYNNDYYSTYEKSSSKYDHTVKFDENLILTNGDEYDLRSVCNHSGFSANFGHYTGDIRQLGTNVWHRCDDSSIEKLTRQRRCKGSTSFHNCDNAIMMIFSKK